MEYDVDIKVKNLVSGKGLCEKLATKDENEENAETKVVIVADNEPIADASTTNAGWVQDMTHFLQTGEYPPSLDKSKKRYFRLQSIPYVLIGNIIFRKDLNGVLLRCIDQHQVDKVLHEFHDGTTGGHFSPRTTAWKIMRAGYYWPRLFKDSHAWAKKFVKCAIFTGKERFLALPL